MSDNRRKAVAYLQLVLALEQHSLWSEDIKTLENALAVLER